jgi:hypothetical protein
VTLIYRQPLETQSKRRRSLSAGADTSTVGQTLARISEQDDAGAHSHPVKQRKSPMPLNNHCVSLRVSTPKLASSPSRNVTEPPVANTSDRSFRSNDGNDVDIGSAIVNSNHGLGDSESEAIEHDTSPYNALRDDRLETASQPILFSRQSPSAGDGSERLHMIDVFEAPGNSRNRSAGGCDVVIDGGDGGAGASAAGASAATRQPGSVDFPLPEKSTAGGPLHRADFRRLHDGENDRCRAKWDRRHRQRKQSSSATGKAPAAAIKPTRSSFTRRKSRLEHALERGRTRVKFAPSRYRSGSPSPSPRRRPATTEMKLLRGRGKGEDSSWRETAPQKLTQMSLRHLPSGESFLAAVIQDDRNVAAFSYDQSMMLIDRTLGDAWQIDCIAVTPLTLNSWLLNGYLHSHCNAVRTDLDRIGTTQASGFSSDLETDSDVDSESDTRMLRSKTLDTGIVPLIDNESSSEDDGSTNNDTDLDRNGLYSSEEDETDGPKPVVSRRRRPWKRSEEDLLREYIKRNEPWDEIGKKLIWRSKRIRRRYGVVGKEVNCDMKVDVSQGRQERE